MIRKNGHRQGKQNYRCKDCDRQFITVHTRRGYSDEVKQICLRMYHLGLKLREIERLTGIRHTTIHSWVKQSKSDVMSSSNNK
ncbi:IS1 transposase [Leptolyngbya boryana NIES-2135]|uniref:IS1 transposase n=2 Tax=Leptolyngbya group TaxID=3081713 RepID=A0A1Z4JJM8_LEPBY|nr:transposase [Leptolyngbya boryana]MBD2368965.1 IS1 family transposase [Leptolyngbya sp. FACHB-161]MBD2399941.1 IS1 family transposase [Leptolyngbya sp. FACHB-239]BAY56888.1 IS1 transposase [Leptolyngbya boryana NIES-2135]